MDWNLKTPIWGFPEFQQEPNYNTGPVGGSSSLGVHGSKGDFSIDLKLGHVVNRVGNESMDNLQVPSVPKMVPGSAKRARAVHNAILAATCLVDGCQADLSNCREYHRRHKVCERHSKTPEVEIGSRKQRFCQQCSRFHSLEEFDEGKRSCRKRLDGHNRRRRKPQPEPMSRAGSFLSNYQGGAGLFPFSGSEVYPTTALTNPMWPGVVKTKQDSRVYDQHLLDKQNTYHGSSSNSYGAAEGKQFNFLQPVPEAPACQPFRKTVAASSESCFSSQVSNCALSLLSSPPLPLQQPPPEISFKNHMLPLPTPCSIQPAHSVNSRVHSNNLETMDSLLVPGSSDTAAVHCQDMFHMGHDSSSENDVSQTLPFCWE